MRLVYFSFFTLLLCLYSLHSLAQGTKHYCENESGTIQVSGNTTIGNFSCSTVPLFASEEGPAYIIDGQNLTFLPIQLLVSVDGFDCGNPIISSDLSKILNSAKYPFVHVDLKTLHLRPPLITSTSALAKVRIMDIEKEETLTLHMSHVNGKVQLEGSMQLDLFKYDIEQPTRFFGLIKIDRHIQINFKLLYD